MTRADMIAAALRPIAPGGKLASADVPLINQLGALWDARAGAAPVVPTADPLHIQIARSKIGEREVPGTKHNPWILSFWKQTPWLKTDDADSPWCGGFVKWCLEQAGLPYPKEYPRAASYATWGTACPAQLGAIGVKARAGGNHVFFIVGITPDRRYYKALGGNQRDMVSIVDIAVGEVNAIRWPAGLPLPARSAIYLPVLPAGTISSSEA